jgi:heme exporter protein C
MRTALFIALTALTGLAMVTALALVFLYAPTEARMGIVQKIFYFHVSSAYTMYLAWAVCTFSSLAYLVRRREKWDMVARSAAELALLFAGVVLATGPLWGRKAWGAYWTWDPRLTSTLMFTLIVVSYALLRSLASGEAERRFGAALAILGSCIAPIIHFSVQQWRGQHPTVITAKGGGLAPEMRVAFAVSMITFTLFFALLLGRRYSLEQRHRALERLREQAAAMGLDKAG